MNKLSRYTAKEIKPDGWLKRQLQIQADGLCGNLDKVWRDVRDSAWIGGDAEGWERLPYWLDGFIPLAYLLEDEKLIKRAEYYIRAILSKQRSDGWICPCADGERAEYDLWGAILISKVLTEYYRCSGDEAVPQALYNMFRNLYDSLKSGNVKLFGWGKYRWFEAFVGLKFIREKYKEQWITDLGGMLKAQGVDYASIAHLWERPLNKWSFDTHIVNLAMMLKEEAVCCELLGEAYTHKADRLRETLERYNGTPVEMFTGDECLAGLSPIRGTELCAVVEQMYSYALLYAYTADSRWAERLEVLAFNALPAAVSDDMWTHQYDQQSNQINCVKFSDKPVWGTNGADANLFGLEPNYGCCTANFGQGWSKFVLSAFLHDGDRIISAVPVPSKLHTADTDITLITEYPFENKLLYTVESKKDFVFAVRIPSFAQHTEIDGKPTAITGELEIPIKKGETRKIDISFETSPKFIPRPHGLYSVKCGSLVFSLPIKYKKVMHEYTSNGVERKFPYCDYELIGKSEWRYCFRSDNLKAEYSRPTSVPFSSENPPVTVTAEVARVDWDYLEYYDNVCAVVPTLPLRVVGKPEKIRLYPYGCAKLRMTELPKLN